MTRLRVGLVLANLLLASSVVLAQGAEVSGRVTRAGGGPLANADVTLRPLPRPGQMANMPGMQTTPDRTAQSRADGSFSFDQVAPGQYAIFADSTGFERSSQELTVASQAMTVNFVLEALDVPGAESRADAGTATDTQALLDRIKTLEQRISDLESGTVLSEPETRVKRIEVYVDPNGNQYDQPTPGTRKEVTYQRERVYRRQSLSEKLEQAFADQDARRIAVGVSAASVTQFATQTRGSKTEADNHAYQLSSADLYFSAGLAQYTSFFADIVGLSGAPPDAEIPGLTLLNSYTARLIRQNEVNIREAWLRTELFGQRLAVNAGRLDLTNFFDRNAAANDETSQFIGDALVNNPMLGLAANGAGVVGIYDPKNGFAFKGGFQQSNTDATNLSQSMYTLGEVDYLARPPGLSEGTYRLWVRNDNTGDNRDRSAFGISLDQRLNAVFGLFARYGNAQADVDRDQFYSGGFQVQHSLVVSPTDFWGVGYAQTRLAAGDDEKLVEGYYNFAISGRLRLSLHLQHVLETPAGTSSVGFLVPALRLQASF